MINELDVTECPCNDCIVRSTCRHKFVIKKKGTDTEYLVTELLNKCPFASEYYHKYYKKDTYSMIHVFCKIHNILDDQFVWWHSEIW